MTPTDDVSQALTIWIWYTSTFSTFSAGILFTNFIASRQDRMYF